MNLQQNYQGTCWHVPASWALCSSVNNTSCVDIMCRGHNVKWACELAAEAETGPHKHTDLKTTVEGRDLLCWHSSHLQRNTDPVFLTQNKSFHSFRSTTNFKHQVIFIAVTHDSWFISTVFCSNDCVYSDLCPSCDFCCHAGGITALYSKVDTEKWRCESWRDTQGTQSIWQDVCSTYRLCQRYYLVSWVICVWGIALPAVSPLRRDSYLQPLRGFSFSFTCCVLQSWMKPFSRKATKKTIHFFAHMVFSWYLVMEL